MLLPDINVWLASAFDVHAHHESADSWFQAAAETRCFCRLTQQGFLRLATNPSVFKKASVSLIEAWGMYDHFFHDSRVAYASEPSNLEHLWRTYTQRRSFSPNFWNDAYLAAFARSGNLQLITFDRGFLQFDQLDCRILT